MSDIFNAAVVQAAPALFDTPKTIAKLADLTRDAAGKGARLVVFPEAFVGGSSDLEPAIPVEPKEDALCSD
jgi:nitrilase